MMKEAPPFREIVVDGFESFEYSQYFPIHHHVAVEKGTDFFIHFTDSELRRKGRMTEAPEETASGAWKESWAGRTRRPSRRT